MTGTSSTSETSGTSLTKGAQRICVVNAKGGVGKTTIAINLAGALNHHGIDVLFVDLDPQGVATEGLGLEESYDAEPPTIFDALTDPGQRDVVNDLIVEHAEMDVLPSSIDLLNAERELTIADLMAQIADRPDVDIDPSILDPLATRVVATDVVDGSSHAKDQLAEVLEAVDREYDVIVVDAPPFYGEIFDNALFAAPSVVIPALAESTSQRAIEILFEQVAVFEETTGVAVNEVGAFANRIRRSTNESDKMLTWLNRVFDGVPLFEIPERVALQYAYNEGVSVLEYDEDADVGDMFLEAAEDIVDELETAEEIQQ